MRILRRRPTLRTADIPSPWRVKEIKLSPGVVLEIVRESSGATEVDLHGVGILKPRFMINEAGWRALREEAERQLSVSRT